MSFIYKTVLLTGATGGIGQEVAKLLDEQGVALLLTGRNEQKLEHLHASLSGTDHAYIAADLTNKADRERLIAKAGEIGVQALINMAGVNQLSLLEQTSDASIDKQIEMNLLAPIKLCQEITGLLATQEQAAIVNVGSILGSIGYAGSTIYCATKFGLRGFSEALRRELADTSIKVVYVAPRATDTEMNSTEVVELNQKLGVTTDSPKQVAQAIVNALGKQAKYRFIGWPERLFVKLNALFPALIDMALLKQLPIIRRYATHRAS